MSKIIVIGSAFIAINAGYCEEAPAQKHALNLTIQDAIKMALEQNPDVLRNRERIVETSHNIPYTVAQILPNISGLVTTTDQKAAVNKDSGGSSLFGGHPYNQYAAQIKWVQPLYSGGAFTNGLGLVQKEKEIRQLDLEVNERDLTVQVIEAFYSVLSNQQLFEILKETKTVQEQSFATSERYYKIGRAQLIDVLQAKTQLALILPQIAAAENQMKSAASQLVTLLHQNQTDTINLSGPIAYIEPETAMNYLSKKKQLPEIQKNQIQISQFQNQMGVTLAPYNPSLSLQSSIGRQAFTMSDLFNDFSTNWSVGLQLSIPIFNGLASVHQRGVLSSQLTQLEYGQNKILDTLSYNQIQTERGLNVAATILKGSKLASEYSRASLKEAQRDFKLQTINYLQLLISQENNLNAESSYVQAQYSYIDAVTKYFVAAGIPISNLVEILDHH